MNISNSGNSDIKKNYHIHYSTLCTDETQTHTWDGGFWSRIETNDLSDVVGVANEMSIKWKEENNNWKYNREPRFIIGEIVDQYRNGCEMNIIYDNNGTIVKLKDINNSMKIRYATTIELYSLKCFRDDLKDVSEEETESDSSDDYSEEEY